MKKVRTWQEYLETADFPPWLQETAGKYNKKMDLMFWTLVVVSLVGLIPEVGMYLALIGILAAFWLRHYEFRVVKRLVNLMRVHIAVQAWERKWQREGMVKAPGGAWVGPGA